VSARRISEDMQNREHSLVLDAMSELFAATTYGNYRNVVMAAFEVKGHLDLEAMKLALDKAVEAYPKKSSRVREVWRRGRFRLAWEYRPHLHPSWRLSDLKISDPHMTVFDALVRHLEPRMERGRNLFEETPSEHHIIHLGKDHHVIGSITHHSSTDAGSVGESGKFLLAQYHQILTGRKPEWADKAQPLSSLRKDYEPQEKTKWKGPILGATKSSVQTREKSCLPVGSGRAHEQDCHFFKQIFSADETNRIIEYTAALGVTVADLLVASIHLTIDQWNFQRKALAETVATTFTVNLRSRFPAYDNPNSLSVINFRSSARDRKSPGEFVRSVWASREGLFRMQQDLRALQKIEHRVKAASIFPFRVKQGVARFLMAISGEFSGAIHINSLGVVFPKYHNDRITGDSWVIKAGDLEVTEVHGLAYKFAIRAPLIIWVYTYRNKLNVILGAWASHFTREEGESFIALVAKHLLVYPE